MLRILKLSAIGYWLLAEGSGVCVDKVLRLDSAWTSWPRSAAAYYGHW